MSFGLWQHFAYCTPLQALTRPWRDPPVRGPQTARRAPHADLPVFDGLLFCRRPLPYTVKTSLRAGQPRESNQDHRPGRRFGNSARHVANARAANQLVAFPNPTFGSETPSQKNAPRREGPTRGRAARFGLGGKTSAPSLRNGIGAPLFQIGAILLNPGYFHALPKLMRLTKVPPEPSTWAMTLIGFAGLGYAGYRRANPS